MSSKKTQKGKSAKKALAAESGSKRCVLVATYKKESNQLKWIGKRHLYNCS